MAIDMKSWDLHLDALGLNQLSTPDANFSRFGGVFLYALSFLMLLVPIAIFLFEAKFKPVKEDKVASTIITHLQVYPIKSCRGIPLKSVKLLRTGLDLDRKWMFVDKDMKFITIREHSRMTLINTFLTSDDHLQVKVMHQGKELGFKVPAHPDKKWLEVNTEKVTAEIWSVETDAWMYPESLTAELNDFFEQPVRFVMKGPTPRVLGSNGAPKLLGRTESTMFPDMMPVLVANEKSLEELNGRLEKNGNKTITFEHYRPNIVVAGLEPWEEDRWKTLKIVTSPESETQVEKGVVLDVTQRCARCQVPNIDPETGIPDKKEPFSITMKYRRVDKGITFRPCFGMLCAPRAETEISVGMRFDILKVTDDHLYIRG